MSTTNASPAVGQPAWAIQARRIVAAASGSSRTISASSSLYEGPLVNRRLRFAGDSSSAGWCALLPVPTRPPDWATPGPSAALRGGTDLIIERSMNRLKKANRPVASVPQWSPIQASAVFRQTRLWERRQGKRLKRGDRHLRQRIAVVVRHGAAAAATAAAMFFFSTNSIACRSASVGSVGCEPSAGLFFSIQIAR